VYDIRTGKHASLKGMIQKPVKKLNCPGYLCVTTQQSKHDGAIALTDRAILNITQYVFPRVPNILKKLMLCTLHTSHHQMRPSGRFKQRAEIYRTYRKATCRDL
jgi:hypothetical protein